MRRSDEDREEEYLEDEMERFKEKNQNRSVKFINNEGEEEKVSLSQFFITNEQLLGK